MILLAITLVTNFGAQVVVRRFERQRAGTLMDEGLRLRASGRGEAPQGVEPRRRGDGHARRTHGVAVLVILVGSVFKRGRGGAERRLLHERPSDVRRGGRRDRACARRLAADRRAIGTAIALPVGVLLAIFVSEFARPRVRHAITLVLDVLNGFPSIVIGIFVFALLVVGHHQSGFAGGFALAIIMLPLVARATMEVLALVPTGFGRRASRSAPRAGAPSSGSCSRPRSEGS